ncbi:hypothetical protein [Kitasatospora sp. Root107]|uniref:hypothetical protein n=1 Tax=Kitasatospora sp. Root107 TaxID=1736424 RepID=UPI00070E6859|nr:hypothetical protein [Kitasatospora sp. Root107]KQV18581.1 hypothetical protein ASC99_04980 [Kitasatospora sp. Root107]
MAFARRTKVLLGVAAAAVLVELIGGLNRLDGGFVLLRGLHRPGLLFPVVLVALLTAVLLGRADAGTKVLTSLLVGLLLFLTMSVAMVGGFDGPRRTEVLPAPDGSGRRLVVDKGADWIDPLWWVSVESGSGPTARRWKIGYFDGDDHRNALVEAVWDGPGRVRLVTGDQQVHLIDVGSDGRPGRTLSLRR